MRRICTLLTITTTALLFLSCEHKPLYVENYDLFQVRVNFDFSQLEQRPGAMRVFFYPLLADATIGQPQIYDIAPSGGVAYLPSGEYHVVAYNVDPNNIIDVDEDFYSSFQLTTTSYTVTVTEDDSGDELLPAARRHLFGANLPYHADEPNYQLEHDNPDWSCVCRKEHFVVDPLTSPMIANDDGSGLYLPLTLEAAEATVTVVVEVRGAEGLELATLVRGTLSGVPDAHVMGLGLPSSVPTLVAFSGRIDREQGVITGTTSLWGFYLPQKRDERQFLNLYVWSERGNYYISEDITEQMQHGLPTTTAEGTRRLVITLNSTLNFYDWGGNGNSGFAPNVGEWGEENANIQM